MKKLDYEDSSQSENENGTELNNIDKDDMFSDDAIDNKADGDDMFADEQEEDIEDDMFASDKEEEEEDVSDDYDEDIDNDYYNNVEDFENGQFRNKKQPKIESFKLDKDEDVKIDEDGNYLPTKEDSDEEQWMHDYKKSDIKKARLAQKQREDKINNKNSNMDPIDEILSELIELLEATETPLEALARLNIKSKKKKSQPYQSQIKPMIQKITDLCSILMNDKSINDIYDLSKEELMRLYQSKTGQPYNRGTKRKREEEDDTIDYGEKIWYFKYIDEDEINGPFSSYEMKYWKDTYFDNKVLAKRKDEEEFKSIESIQF